MRLSRTARRVVSAAGALCVLGVSAWATAAAGPAGDPDLPKQWGMTVIGAPAAWGAGDTGNGITIAFVDTGVDFTHPEFKGRVLDGKNFVTPGARPQDDNGHGTHVAGIAAANLDGAGVSGVAPDARILPVKALDNNGTGSGNDIDAGIRWAADQGAQVINLSIESVGQGVFGPAFSDALAYAWSKGSIPVVAAGNDYVLSSGYGADPAIVVSATDACDHKPDFSSGVGQAKWGIAAPGGAGTITSCSNSTDIWSTWLGGGYAYDAGTSMSAPHVAGAAAVLRSMGLSAQQTVDRLLSTAKNIGPSTTFGAGRLDLAKAVGGLTPAPTPRRAGTLVPASSPTSTTAGGAVLAQVITSPTDSTRKSRTAPAAGESALGSTPTLGSRPTGVASAPARATTASRAVSPWPWVALAAVLLGAGVAAWALKRSRAHV